MFCIRNVKNRSLPDIENNKKDGGEKRDRKGSDTMKKDI